MRRKFTKKLTKKFTKEFTKKINFSAILFCSILVMAVSLNGCQKELTKEEVIETSYYKNLKKKYDNLKKEKKELEEQLEEATKTDPDDQRAITYLRKLQKDSLVKLEVAPANDPYKNSFFSQKAILKSATNLIRKSDLTYHYTPETLKKDYKAKYVYTLYDEDNSIFEITVYEGNYIVFSDLPHKVYYCYNADLIGNAFLETREDDDAITLPLLYKISQSPIVLVDEGEVIHTRPVIQRFTKLFNELEKEEMEQNTQDAEKKQVTYTFYDNGKEIILTIYETQLSMEDGENGEIWCRLSEKEIEKIRKILD